MIDCSYVLYRSLVVSIIVNSRILKHDSFSQRIIDNNLSMFQLYIDRDENKRNDSIL
jgi:hypothetical protein